MADIFVALQDYARDFRLHWADPTIQPAKQHTCTTSDPRTTIKRRFNASDSILTILVGETSERFSIHRSILSSTSKFFQARLKLQWSRDASAQVLKLPDHDPAAFDLYVNWLYTHNLPMGRAGLNSSSDDGDSIDENWLELISAYVLGQALLDTAFKDILIDAMAAMLEPPGMRPSSPALADAVWLIWDGTTSVSPARDLLLCAFSSDVTRPDQRLDELPEEFTSQLHAVKARDSPVLAVRVTGAPSSCRYHCHGGIEQCYLSAEI